MAGELEINYKGAKVHVGENGRLFYEGEKEDRKALEKALKPIFDAIKSHSNYSYVGNDRKIDTDEERKLFLQLKSIFETYTNDDIEGNELQLGDEFVKGGYRTAKGFLYTKEKEINDKKLEAERAEEEKQKKAAERRKAEAEEKEKQEAEEIQAQKDAEFAEWKEEYDKKVADIKAQEQKKAKDKEVFNASIMKMAGEVDTSAISGGQTYTIKKGDSFWNIAKQSLMDGGTKKPTNIEIMRRMAEICALNNINMSTLKLRPGVEWTLPGAGGAGGASSKSGASTPTVSVATQEDFENKTDDGSWEIVNDAKVYQDGSGNIQIVQKSGTVPSGYTEVDVNNTLCRDVASGNYYYVPQTPPPSGGASGSSSKSGASTPTVSEATQQDLDDNSDWNFVNNFKVWKDPSGNIEIKPDTDTVPSDWTLVDATLCKDDDGNYHYVMNK